MSDSDNARKEEIEALLAERKKYEAWLAQLESRRASAAEHVFARVYADYSGRLESVRTKLGERAETLESIVADLEKRLGHEQDKITAKTDERAEAELRAMVGEFEDKDWENTKSKLDSSIRSLRARFDGTERELADLKGLLQSVRGISVAARASMIQAAAETVADALDSAADPDGVVTATAAEATVVGGDDAGVDAPAPDAPADDPAELDFDAPPGEVNANADAEPQPEPELELEPIDVAEPAPEPEPLRAPTPFDELAFLKAVAATPTAPKGMAAVELGAGMENAVPDEPPSRPRTSSSKAVESEPVPLGAPTPRTSQAIRTLKCGECDTLNFPTEWYCERCGGELAAF